MIKAAKTGLGDICFLWMQSPLHVNWKIEIMRKSVLPAILNDTYLIYYEDSKPVAYISWAYFNEDDEIQYIESPHSLKTQQWKSGDRLWMIDLIAPYGHIFAVTKHLKEDVFPSEVAHFMRVKKGKKIAKIATLHGKESVGMEVQKLKPINSSKFKKFRVRTSATGSFQSRRFSQGD